jgi:hypothetical protein
MPPTRRLLVRLLHSAGVHALITEQEEAEVIKRLRGDEGTDPKWIELAGINQANDFPVNCCYERAKIEGYLIETFDPRMATPQAPRIHH